MLYYFIAVLNYFILFYMDGEAVAQFTTCCCPCTALTLGKVMWIYIALYHRNVVVNACVCVIIHL